MTAVVKPKLFKLAGRRSGQRVSRKVLFGPDKRYAVYAVLDTFNRIVWFVDDAESLCWCCGDRPQVIRQATDFDQAIAGLHQVELT